VAIDLAEGISIDGVMGLLE